MKRVRGNAGATLTSFVAGKQPRERRFCRERTPGQCTKRKQATYSQCKGTSACLDGKVHSFWTCAANAWVRSDSGKQRKAHERHNRTSSCNTEDGQWTRDKKQFNNTQANPWLLNRAGYAPQHAREKKETKAGDSDQFGKTKLLDPHGGPAECGRRDDDQRPTAVACTQESWQNASSVHGSDGCPRWKKDSTQNRFHGFLYICI